MQIPTDLATSLTRYFNHLSGQNVSQHTTIAYQSDLTQFLSWLTDNDVTVDNPIKITPTHISDFLTYLASLGRSGVTRVRKLAAIREYLRFLVEVEKRLPSSPADNLKRPKQERKERVFLRIDEYMRLLNAAVGQPRDYAILQVFLQTGLRVSELVGLEMPDIDPDGGTMLIDGKGKKQRTIYLEKKATQAIRSYLASRPPRTNQQVFLNYQGNGLSVRGVMDIVEKYRVLSGISKKFSCHSLRHTCATYKAAKGYTPRDLQDLLGHEKPETSFIYVHLARDAKKLMEQTSL